MLAGWVSAQGHEARHVRDLGLREASDQEIWEHALRSDAVIVTKDRDFAEWSLARRPAPATVWLRFGNINNTMLLLELSVAWARISASLEAGVQLVEAGP